jgi:hypothetical protein
LKCSSLVRRVTLVPSCWLLDIRRFVDAAEVKVADGSAEAELKEMVVLV